MARIARARSLAAAFGFATSEKGITEDDCVLLASYGRWEEMDTAIHQVIAESDCLTFYEDPSYDDSWGSAPVGSLACK